MLRAVFIGVDRHADPEIKDLTGAVRDATALWAVLSDGIPDLNAQLITNEDATFERVSATLDDTLGVATEDDIVILSFAGHGTFDHRLVFNDTQAVDLPGTTYDMENLARQFQLCRARVTIILLDCCFSGGAAARVIDFGMAARDPIPAFTQIAGEGRVIFAASRPDQSAFEDQRTRHGLFTKALLGSLLAETETVSLMAIMDAVTRQVRTDATRMGYIQEPVMFGHVSGELSLPSGRRGANYREAFPDRSTIKTTGAFSELGASGIALSVLHAWEERFPAGLNSLQIEAVNEYAVLDDASLVVVAPTSAGKTFVGEMAAMKAISEGRKAIFLLPYKALVNEKFEDFSHLYGEQLGLRIARCSGDWQDQVMDVTRGKYDLAFFTYEKFLSLSLAAPHILGQIGLVVLDEAQFITEPGRGMTVELLLTHFVSARQRGIEPQLITLSAVIGNTNHFEDWLGCGLLSTSARPVPLIEGVIDRSGICQFNGVDGPATEIQLLERRLIQQRGAKQSSQDVIVPLVRQLVSAGEKVIVFRNQRGSSAGCAEYLARELGLPAAQSVLALLPRGDPSAMSTRLQHSLSGGVAFHNGDLNRDERVAVERGFRQRDGGIEVLVATTTVAAGVNTPASTVIIVETAFAGPTEQPFTVAQYKNMVGRAGRLGYETQGKSIIVTESGFERGQMFRRYVQGSPEAIVSSLNPRQPGTWIIRLLAQVRDVPRNDVVDLLCNTFGGYTSIRANPGWRTSTATIVGDLIRRLVEDELVEDVDGNLRLTMLGRACGESPLTLESSLRLVEMLKRLSDASISVESLLVLTQALPESDEDYTPQHRSGEGQWQRALYNRIERRVSQVLSFRAENDRQYYGRCKRALILFDWLDGVPSSTIETAFSTNPFSRVGHGDIRGYAENSRYLLEAVVRIAAIVLGDGYEPEVVSSLMRRLELGIPAEALTLLDLGVILNRGEIMTLLQARLTTAQLIDNAGEAALAQLLGSRGQELFRSLKRPVLP